MNAWVEAARPRTLPASVAPVVVGTAAANDLIVWRALAALIVSLSLQLAVNFANDLFDAERGVDTQARRGPRRAVASGLITAGAMKKAIMLTVAIAGLAGLALTAAVGWELLVVGAAAILAALTYSGGGRPYGSNALGEIMVFVFFGLVATAGSAYVQDEALSPVALVAAVPIGLLAAAILIVNNLRDIPTDHPAGKVTMAVVLGPTRTVIAYRGLIVLSFLCLLLVVAVASTPWPFLAAAAAPLAPRPLREVHAAAEPQDLIRALGETARLQLAFAFLLAAGLWISN